MSWYALESVEDAVDDTKEFLFPINWKLWTKIAIIALFIGNIGSVPTLPTTEGDFGSIGVDSDRGYAQIDSETHLEIGTTSPELDSSQVISNLSTQSFYADSSLLFLGILAAIFALVFLYISAVFEFIFYQSLIDEEVEIGSYFGEHALNGAKYLGIFVSVLLLLGLSGAVAMLGFSYSQLVGVFLILVLAPIWLVAFLFLFFTQNMVLPEIVNNKTSFVEAYEAVKHYLYSEWKQAGLFLIGKLLIDILATVLVFIAAIFIFLIILIPAALLGILLFIIHPALVAIVAILGVIVFIILYLYLQVPVQTFIYEYVIAVYYKFEE